MSHAGPIRQPGFSLVDSIQVFNKKTYEPCRHCAHSFARGSGCLCGQCGPLLTNCPSCGCPVELPSNASTLSIHDDLTTDWTNEP